MFAEGFGAALPSADVRLGGSVSDVMLFELAFLDKSASARGPLALERELLVVEHHMAIKMSLALESVRTSLPSANEWTLESSCTGQ